MLVYTAGPYSADTEEEIQNNIDTASIVAAKLWEKGHAVICPHMNTAHFEHLCHASYDQYLVGDFQIITRCDAMVMLPGWEDSKGAKLEHQRALELGLPIYIYPNLPELHPTELRSPQQARAFAEILGRMYRVHLQKNADYCVDPNTKILTDDLRWIPIKNLKVGDGLIGFTDLPTGWLSKRKYEHSIVESITTVHLPSYELTLEDGETIVSSAQHPWLVMSGTTGRWLETEKLQSLEEFKNPSRLVRLFETWEYDSSRDAGYLAAALDGEGWLTHKPNPRNLRSGHNNWVFTLGFAQRNNEMLAEVERILHDRNIEYHKKFAGSTEQIIFSQRDQIVKLIGSIRPLRLLPHVLPSLGRIKHYPLDVTKKRFLGETELISIKTSSGTYIANGIASHNSPANILATGEVGLITRLWDKTARLLNLMGFRFMISEAGQYTAPTEPKHESIEDTYMDMAVYAIIGLLLRKGVWGK